MSALRNIVSGSRCSPLIGQGLASMRGGHARGPTMKYLEREESVQLIGECFQMPRGLTVSATIASVKW